MKRVYPSSLSLYCFPLIASAGFGLILAGRVPARADDETTAGAMARASALAKTVTIHRDTFGVPHVYGPTDASCVFGFIYAQAEDYFWQIEDSYLRSLGRAAEVYGEKSLPDDLVNRALEITRLSQDEYRERLAENQGDLPGGRRRLELFPRGQSAGQAPADHALRAVASARVSPLYSLSVVHLRQVGLARRPISSRPFRRFTTTKSARSHSPRICAPSWRPSEQDRQGMSEHVGSNMWAVRPDKSASGKALMFINPHQPFFGPGQWYEGHVVSGEGWNLLGACFFGSPFPTLGYNGHIAWSHTVNNPDIVDLYTITFDDKADPLKYRYGDGSRQATAWTDDVVVKD